MEILEFSVRKKRYLSNPLLAKFLHSLVRFVMYFNSTQKYSTNNSALKYLIAHVFTSYQKAMHTKSYAREYALMAMKFGPIPFTLPTLAHGISIHEVIFNRKPFPVDTRTYYFDVVLAQVPTSGVLLEGSSQLRTMTRFYMGCSSV